MRLPVSSPYKITLPYGVVDSLHPNGHNGVDFSGRYDRTVYATETGIVRRVKQTTGGNCIYLDNANRQSRFAHLSQYLIVSGEQVRKGQALGIMGMTGVATGVHLHWSLLIDGKYVDPLDYVEDNDVMVCNPDADDVKDFFALLKGLPGQTGVPSAVQIASYTKQPWQVLAGDVTKTATAAYKEAKAKLAAEATPLISGKKYIAP